MTIRCQVEIKNRLGLHARPAMKLFELIQTFRSTVVFRNNQNQNEEARADSVLAMLMLDSEQGSFIEVEATGPDENSAIEAIISLFDSGFDED
ncbi:PTS phosphocarrier protein NPr [Morganella morganii]|uniref:PTS phosphocarrier protein NPr n=1 Tax=Morganella morganii TaxID=582 RepID=UPI0034D3E8CF